MTHKKVLEVIKHRQQTGSLPGKRKDPYKLALCVEGGGMRGVVTGGSLAAIEDLGLNNVFDTLYGASAGAYNDLYFLSGCVYDGAKLYIDFANNHQFVSVWRFLRGGELFDLDYMFHQMDHFAPVDWHRVIHSTMPLHIVATSTAKGDPAILKNFKSKTDVQNALRTTAQLPTPDRPMKKWRNQSLVDAALADPFCLHSALKEKNTHILVLASMPIKHRHSFGIIDRKLVTPYLQKISPTLGEVYLHHTEYSVNGLSHVWNHFDGTHVSVIAPTSKRKLPKQLTIKRSRMGHGFMAGLDSVLRELTHEDQRQQIFSSARARLRI